jgi:hypothetical protein
MLPNWGASLKKREGETAEILFNRKWEKLGFACEP